MQNLNFIDYEYKKTPDIQNLYDYFFLDFKGKTIGFLTIEYYKKKTIFNVEQHDSFFKEASKITPWILILK
jgi:hypothetical protein